MEKSKLLTILSGDLDVFRAHLKRISKENYALHELDKDMLLQKTRDLYNNILKLNTNEELQKEEIVKESAKSVSFEIKSTISETEQKKETEKIIEPEKVELPPEPKIFPENVISYDIEREYPNVVKEIGKEQQTQNEVPKTEDFLEIEILEKEEELNDNEITSSEPKQKSVETGSYDLFSTETKTLSDRFTGKEEQSLADKLQESEINDLREAIGINEKFLFINELFNGDMGRYNNVLDQINSMQSKSGINTLFMEITIERQWNTEMEAYLKFKDLVDRKFI
jgi:hypothetical protein